MPLKTDPELGINSWLEDELYQQYLSDRSTVDKSWKEVFEGASNGHAGVAPLPAPTAAPTAASENLQPLRGIAAKIAENMNASVTIPLATSQRVIPVKVMDENRRIINQHRTLVGRSKVSYTHLIGWAILKALEDFPGLNHAYGETNGQPARIAHPQINLGIAVDVPTKDGGRNLLVPNIKNAGGLDFARYVTTFDDLVDRARKGKLAPADFQGTTISLTNPGTVGTMSSSPRLMTGQGAIIAAGAIDYPAEYQGAAPETRSMLGISKVMSLSCTYDHRIIQGAESGMFLGRVQALLDGRDGFYEEIFAHLKMPHQPVRWEADRHVLLPGASGRTAEIAKEAGVLQLINAYRVRGHLIADLDPLGCEPSYHAELDPVTYGLTIWDLDREFLTGSLSEAIGEHGSQHAPKPVATLREILETLRQTYCGKIGCEYMNIQHPEQKSWLQHRMEPQSNNWPLVVMGMAHRGRLTVLATVVGKPLARSSPSSKANIDPASTQGSGDVKYHLGAQRRVSLYQSAANSWFR
jgi:multifunctional 2-oxoglutarate metabolism enzyme